jgi:hypothetical protein
MTDRPGIDGGSFARGWFAALEHLAGFINTLDSGPMSGKEVRTAIYSECLTSRPPTLARKPAP